jgi:hypothetical protein
MANKINKALCASSFGNTGFGDCFLEPAKFVGAFQVPSNFQIAEADVANLQEFLRNKLIAAIGTRIFPYHNFINVNDSTEDVNITTTDYGAKYINRDGFYDFTFRYLKGGVMLHQEIQKNGGQGKSFLFYDDNGVLYGYKSGGKLKGIPTDIFYVKPWGLPTGADQAKYELRWIINPRYMNKGNLGYIPTADANFNLFDIGGLQNIALELVNLVSNVATVRAFTAISAVDLHEAYAASLARTSAWVASNNFGNPVGITAVTDNVSAGGWDITFLNGNFLASDYVLLKTTTAALLAASPILMEGFETVEALQIEAPAS